MPSGKLKDDPNLKEWGRKCEKEASVGFEWVCIKYELALYLGQPYAIPCPGSMLGWRAVTRLARETAGAVASLFSLSVSHLLKRP